MRLRLRFLAGALGVLVAAVGLVAFEDRTLGLAVLAAVAGLVGVVVAYEEVRERAPRLRITAVKIVDRFGPEFGSGVAVGCCIFADVVNLSRVGNQITGFQARQLEGNEVLPLKSAKVNYTDGQLRTAYNIDGADWLVAARFIGLPAPIGPNGVAKVCGAFFRHGDVNGNYMPLSLTRLVVTVVDARGNRYESLGIEPEVLLAPRA